MNRETRLNLIVLAVLLAVLTPGAVVLFRKKLQPTVRPMFMPHAVQREIAYLSPLETPPGKKRVEPPHTAKWVESLVREHIGERKVVRPTDGDGLPLMSDRRKFQIVAADPTEANLRLWIIVWDANSDADDHWTVQSPAGETPVQRIDTSAIPVPDLVRQELGETGVTRPPHRIVWTAVTVPHGGQAISRLQRGSQDFVNFVPSFTKSAGTTN